MRRRFKYFWDLGRDEFAYFEVDVHAVPNSIFYY